MATAQSIIDSARYDLVDFSDGVGLGIEFDDAELLNYLNRMVGIMDYTLSSLKSDLVFALDDSFTTTANLDYTDISNLNSGLYTRVRRVWFESKRISEQVTLGYMYYTRQWRRSLRTSGDAVASGDYVKIISQNTLDFTGIGSGDNANGTYFTANAAGTMGSGDAVWILQGNLPTLWALHKNYILWPAAVGSIKNIQVEYDAKTAELTLEASMPYTDRFNEFFRELLVINAKAKKEATVEKSDVMFQDLFRTRAMHEEISRGFVPKPYNYTEF